MRVSRGLPTFVILHFVRNSSVITMPTFYLLHEGEAEVLVKPGLREKRIFIQTIDDHLWLLSLLSSLGCSLFIVYFVSNFVAVILFPIHAVAVCRAQRVPDDVFADSVCVRTSPPHIIHIHTQTVSTFVTSYNNYLLK